MLLLVDPWATTVLGGLALASVRNRVRRDTLDTHVSCAGYPSLFLGAAVERSIAARRALALPAIALAMLALSVLQNDIDEIYVQCATDAEDPRE